MAAGTCSSGHNAVAAGTALPIESHLQTGPASTLRTARLIGGGLSLASVRFTLRWLGVDGIIDIVEERQHERIPTPAPPY
jgi:hypothetical protein